MDHPRWQEVELSCRTSTFNRPHYFPAWSQGLSRNQRGRDTALPGSACLALCSALLHLLLQPGAQRGTFSSEPRRRQLVQLLWLANPVLEVSQHYTAPLSHACLHPLWGWGVLVTTMDVPLSHSPALPLEHYSSIPAGLRADSMEQTDSGHFRRRLGCYLHAEDGLQPLLHTDKQQLHSLPTQHRSPAPRLCLGQAVSVGDAGKALLQGRGARM